MIAGGNQASPTEFWTAWPVSSGIVERANLSRILHPVHAKPSCQGDERQTFSPWSAYGRPGREQLIGDSHFLEYFSPAKRELPVRFVVFLALVYISKIVPDFYHARMPG
jgi:hypothetical protein